MYVNGIAQGTYADTRDYDNEQMRIGVDNTGSYDFDGTISNVRLVKGRALYTGDFYPPSTDLTNVADTKLLCCQSDSSTTTAAVGSLTASGDPTAGAQTITLSLSLGTSLTWPTSITWNGGTAPTLASLVAGNDNSLTGQVFNLTTADGGVTWYLSLIHI